MKSLYWLLGLLPLATNAISNLLERIPELKDLGLDEEQLIALTKSTFAERATCDGNITTIKFPNPTVASVLDLAKRNAFVTRWVAYLP